MTGEWTVACDAKGLFCVVRIVPETMIGPFRDLTAAHAALDELRTADENKKGH